MPNRNWINTIEEISGNPERALYRWKITRLAGDNYCVLSGVRLESLACVQGSPTFSSAAGYLYYTHGRPGVVFADNDLVTAVAGTRIGCNFPSTYRKEGETVSATANCAAHTLSVGSPEWLTQRVLELFKEDSIQTDRLVQPEWVRCSRQPENLKPLYSSELIATIGGDRNSSLSELESLFTANIDKLGRYEKDGYIIPFEHIVSGGRVMCVTDMMQNQTSPVYSIDKERFRAEISRLHWRIKTGEDDGEAADLGRLVKRA